MTSLEPQKKSNNPMDKLKKATSKKGQNSPAKDGGKKAPLTRSQKIFRGPLFWIIVAIIAVTVFGQITNAANRYTEIKTSQALAAISQSQVESAVLVDKSQKIRLILSGGNTIKGSTKVEASYAARQEPTLVDALTANPPAKGWSVEVPKQSFLTTFFFTFGPILIIGFLFFLMMSQAQGGNRVFSFGKSRAKLQNNDVPQNTFADVAGADEAIAELEEIKDFLADPGKYALLGAKIPKGVLLYGPPGTGKTLLARAVAGEAKVPFYSISGSDFVEMFVGVGAARVRDLFGQAKTNAPAIIFIDEIDAVGRARGKSNMSGGNDERENTLNQLLVEMDGFGTDLGIIILAATNRADILDKALLRAGRFDRQIYVDMPDLNERVAIFKVHLKNVKFDNSIDVEFLARQTPGFSGADIANICNESALIAARKGKHVVDKQDFLDAVDRIIGGLEKKNKIITAEEKSTIAYHEGGHAIISWLLEHASPLVKVTIVPRGRSLGAAWYLPEERQITTTEQIFDEMCAALGGRAAEEVAFGRISTGALSDLEKVTKQAYAMVTVYGLNKKIGNRSYYDSSGESQFTKPYSEETARIIDEEVSKIIERAYQKSVELLTQHRTHLDALAKKLLDKEVIFKDDLEEILGPRQWKERNPANEIKPE